MKVVTSKWLALVIALVNAANSSPASSSQDQRVYVPPPVDRVLPQSGNSITQGQSTTTTTTSSSSSSTASGEKHASTGVHVASWQWSYVRTPFIYTSFLVIAGLCKVGFHHANFLSRFVPESCLLIVLGTIVGVILYATEAKDILPHFDSTTFFLYLLPPIMLESSYSLHDRTFVANIGTILLYAVVGTLINCFTIGPTLYGLALAGAMGEVNLPLTEALTFSALISAVDPVAVLAIFQEVGVNKTLYFLVFGESLLNDAVTVVLYNMMVTFTTMKTTIPADQILMGVAVFLCVSIGGLLIGVVFGILTALLTKHTQEVRVMEPLVMLGIAYLSYLTAEMVHFSGIISIIGCGLVQAQYARNNISHKSYTTVKYFSKMLSATCDCMIFLFLGMVLVDDEHKWQTGFVLWTVVLCLLYRFMSVFLLTFLVNKWNHLRQIDVEEQFIMAYGGLRGAVSFSLVVMLSKTDIMNRQLFLTTTLIMVLFTVFVQGASIKPLVHFLKVQRGSDGAKALSLSKEINQTVMDHVMAGVEEIIGRRGDFYLKQIIGHYHEKYLKKWLQRESSDFHNFCKIYEKLAIEDHYAHLYGPATALEEHKKLSLYSEDEDVFIENGDVEKAPMDDVVSVKRATLMFRQASVSKRDSVAQILSPTSSPVRTSKDAVNVLQKAFQEHDYKKFQKYSPDMEEADESEIISTQLRRRRLRTRRLTITAKSPTTSQHSSSQGDTIDPEIDGVTLRRRQPQPTSTLVQVTPPDTTKDFWLERANNRRLKMRSTNPTLQRAQTIDAGGGVPRGGGLSFQVFDFPRVDQSIRPRSTGDLEKRHLASLDTIDESDVNGDSANNDMQLQPLLTTQKSLPSTPPAPMAREESTESKKSLASPRPHSASTTPTSTSSSSKPRLKSGASTESASSRRKHRFSKSHPVDIEDSGDDDSNHESTV